MAARRTKSAPLPDDAPEARSGAARRPNGCHPRLVGFADAEAARRYLTARRLPIHSVVYLYHQASFDDFAQVLHAYLRLGYTLDQAPAPGVTVLTR